MITSRAANKFEIKNNVNAILLIIFYIFAD